MGNVIVTPFDLSDAVQAGRRRYWKQVLPVTSINYKGQQIDFDPEFHMDLAQAFEDKAFDQVPVVFADADNRHNMDPRNFGGDVLKMEYRGPGKDQGTWALIEADKDTAKALDKNPKLGVSARIRQAIDKADGRQFKRAIEHICLTMNPRVTGMGAWQAVDLSEDADIEVVDLTAETYEEGSEMPRGSKTAKATSGKTIDLSALDDDQFQQLLDLAATMTDEDEVVDEDEVEDDEQGVGEVEDPSPTRTKRKKSKTKITVEKDSEEDGDDESEDDEDEVEETDLSDSEQVIKRNEVSQFQQMRIDLAQERWERDRDGYVDAGVPPFLLDLAEPVLSLPDALTIDLADDETLDASDTIRKMLDGVAGVIDMSDEIGHQVDLSEDSTSETDAFLKAWDEQYG